MQTHHGQTKREHTLSTSDLRLFVHLHALGTDGCFEAREEDAPAVCDWVREQPL